MTDRLRNHCELFERNRAAVSKKFMFENAMMSIAAGLIFTGADKEADPDRLKECRSILSQHTGIFSEYRDTVKLALLSEMALSGDPEQYIEDVKAVYKKIHRGHLKDNSYMVLAAMLICDLGKQEHADEIIEKHHEIMQHMEKLHPIITNSEDISYTILLALSDRPADVILSDINACSDYLKAAFKHKIGADSIQGLSELLALTDGDFRIKCDRVIRIFDALKENKAEIGGGYVFFSLGTLTGIDETTETLVNEIMEANEFLKSCKGFDEKSMDKKDRLMFAVLLTAGSFGTSAAMINNTFISSAFGIIKAKQIATMITILSNVLPPVIGAVTDRDNTETDDSETPPPEQEDAENTDTTK
ncbi:MAG: DUF4003 family protein [Oscillospiraceae bacterium]|nr:DUF4003 family protein [Oscillospiraceae bacterium]